MVFSHISTLVSYLEIPVYVSLPFARRKSARAGGCWRSWLACAPGAPSTTERCTHVRSFISPGPWTRPLTPYWAHSCSAVCSVATGLPRCCYSSAFCSSALLSIFLLRLAGNYYATAGVNLKLCPNYNMPQAQPLPF